MIVLFSICGAAIFISSIMAMVSRRPSYAIIFSLIAGSASFGLFTMVVSHTVGLFALISVFVFAAVAYVLELGENGISGKVNIEAVNLTISLIVAIGIGALLVISFYYSSIEVNVGDSAVPIRPQEIGRFIFIDALYPFIMLSNIALLSLLAVAVNAVKRRQ
jgi:NADH:ubiquinone oxidoreductase subunit 6 (subunit J)